MKSLLGSWRGASLTIKNVQELNQDAGTLTENLGIVTEKTVRTQGRIQAVALAVATDYANGDDKRKAELEAAGLIVEDKNPHGNGKKFNEGLIFDAAKTADVKASLEEKAQHIATAVTKAATDAKITPKQIDDVFAVVQSKTGVNQDSAPAVTMINVIAKAVSPEIAKLRDAILPMQALLRSNALDIAAGDLKLDVKAFDFNIPTLGFLPDDVKEMIDAGRQTSERFNAGEKPFIEDIEILAKALDKTLGDIAPIQATLGKKAKIAPLVKMIEKLNTETKALLKKNEAEIKGKLQSAPRGIKFAEIDDTDIPDVEIAENPLEDNGPTPGERIRAQIQKAKQAPEGKIQQLKGMWDDWAQGRQDKAATKADANTAEAAQKELRQDYLKAIVSAFGDKNIAKNARDEFVKGDGLENLIAKTDLTVAEDGKAVFVDRQGGYSFTIDETGVTHDDTDSNVSVEEAILTADLIRLNAKAHKGVEIVGNDVQKAMYFAAMQKFAPDVPIKNLEEIQKIAPATLQTAEAKFATPASGTGPAPPPPGGSA